MTGQNGTGKYPVGVIHGRFQILHNDHLKYLLAGKDLCRHLIVGITNADPLHIKDEIENPERSMDAANPLTYYERMVLVGSALREAGVPDEEYSIVPFPVNMPELYHCYVPMDAVFFITIYDDWGRKKLEYFRSMNLSVHVLWEKPVSEKGISAAGIRSRMGSGEEWKQLVPPCVAELLMVWNITTRIENIKKN
jgi:nicotinamide-nucleotide adenylyltransferase